MSRKQRVYWDRANMARKALVEAGYLAGNESQDELGLILQDVAADFLTDMLHLMREAKVSGLGEWALRVGNEANKNYEADGFKL